MCKMYEIYLGFTFMATFKHASFVVNFTCPYKMLGTLTRSKIQVRTIVYLNVSKPSNISCSSRPQLPILACEHHCDGKIITPDRTTRTH